MYQRKTIDRYDIMVLYETGWEVECSAYTYKEARQDLKDYRDNVNRPVKLEKHREKKTKQNSF